MQIRRTALVATIVALLVIASLGVAQAQPPPGPPPAPQPPPAPLQPGDIVWAFAQEPPLFDDRVATAIASLMAPRIASPAAGVRIVRASQQGAEFAPSAVAPVDQVPLLLRAAGYAQSPPFIQVGQCKVWAGAPASSAGAQAIAALAGALPDALASLGVRPAAPAKVEAQCGVATIPAEAHLLVWVYGGPPPVLPRRNLPTFLASPVLVPSNPPGAAQGGGAAASPGPATTGNAGLVSRDAAHAAFALGAACALLSLGGWLLTGRTQPRT